MNDCDHPVALAAGATSKLVLTVHVLPSAFDPSSRTIQNTATVTGGGSPSAHATDTAPVKALSVLSIDKKLVSYADNLATFRITVANLGPNPTDGLLSVTDRLPTGLRLRSVRASQASWQCDDTVVCLRSAPMPAGSRSTITIVTAVTAPAGSRITNTATMTGGTATSHGRASSAVLEVNAAGGGQIGIRSSGADSGSLAQTGRDNRDLLILAFGLLTAGLGLLLLARRRRRS